MSERFITIDGRRIRDALRVLAHPSYWFRNEPTSDEWDRELLRLMTEYDFTAIGQYTARLGPVEIWTANHPYASFRPRNLDVLPRRATAMRAREKLVRDLVQQQVARRSA